MSQKMTPALWGQIRFFKPTEFNRPELMEWDFLQRLDKARALSGIPIKVIYQAVRTTEHNAAVGGASNSAHLRGWAVDVVCNADRTRYMLLRAFIAAGFVRVGTYPDHLHVDCDPTLPQIVAWVGK